MVPYEEVDRRIVEEEEAAELRKLELVDCDVDNGSISSESHARILAEIKKESDAAQRERQATVRHQQQRLLLLRHAARCRHETTCPVTPHCASIKGLWRHISECKDEGCLVANCVSSRYILAHYRQCSDSRCPVCVPVRDAIRRNHQIAKELAEGGSTAAP
ncbi:hypothetical protein CTAYLR_004445 [Chrysophaeum taylorii]|uniref:histone acetyltransferase n=1 Tax=Chrysophaeum taylorii TaxID=2483200 RepID=A0AAD7UBM4_9STRA|nr:hypothetical protein CTAYLR_004445 [Chrysophaeum taylorii]